MINAVLRKSDGRSVTKKPGVEKPRVRFDEMELASATTRRRVLLCNKRHSAIILALGLICCSIRAFADDITVARGETLDLSESATYDMVTVSGTINIPAGLTLTAATLELGPNEGDEAVINVLGSAATGLNVTNAVNIGTSGGSGQIVAMSPAGTHNTGWDEVIVVKLSKVNISASAAVSSSGFIDFLKLGPGTVDFTTMSNASSSRARVLVKNGCIGYSQNWGKTMFVGPFQVESFDDGDIRLGNSYGQRVLNSGSLVIKGNGKDVYFCRYANGSDQYYSLTSGIVWDSVRDVVLAERHPMVVAADNLLPYGPSTGIFWLRNGDTAILNIGATVQHLNSFSSARGVAVSSLTGNVGARVVFGEGDTDGFLNGRIHDNVGVFKVGTGVFNITNESQVGAMAISNGTVRVAAAFTLNDLTVASGAVLEIDGVTVAPSSGNASVRGEVVLKNGGRLVTSKTVVADERLAGYDNAGEWTKDGSGNLILEDPVCMPSNIHVTAGTVAFTATGYACELFKWNVTAWNDVGWIDKGNGAKSDMFYLGELAFVDPSGNRIGAGSIGSAAIGTAPGDLAAGKASFASGTTLMSAGGGGGASSLFDKNQWPRVGVDSPLTTDEGGVTLYVRLPANSGPVSAINFAAAYGGFPKSWTLSGSADGGQTWRVLNEKSDYVVSDATAMKWMGAAADGVADSVVPKTFLLDDANIVWTSPGVQNMPDSMQVEVDAGAVLDFTNVTGGQVVDAITVDAVSGGGTIMNASIATDGTIFLTGVSEGARIRDLSVALALDGCLAVENLRSWRIYVNGAMQQVGKYHVAYRNGQLSFLGDGLIIFCR